MLIYDKKLDIYVKKVCNNCEFNMGIVCSGAYYGMPIEQITKKELEECKEFGISLITYLDIYQKKG